jgi:hypothetical protein
VVRNIELLFMVSCVYELLRINPAIRLGLRLSLIFITTLHLKENPLAQMATHLSCGKLVEEAYQKHDIGAGIARQQYTLSSTGRNRR